MLDLVLKNGRTLKTGIFLLLLLIGATFTVKYLQSETDTQSPLAKAEKLITTENYYKAILALKPLLTSNEKSEAQEQALWLTHRLVSEVICRTRYFVNGSLDKKIEDTLNQLGADFDYFEMSGPIYDMGFLDRLIDEYPDSPKRPIIEYLSLFWKRSRPNEEVAIEALHAYVDKYEKTGRYEVYRAHLDIARLHHGLWAALTYPDEPGPGGDVGAEYTSGDAAEDKKRAAAHKTEALKYYALYHLNPYGLPDDEGYERLKKNERFGWDYLLIYGC